MNTGRYMVETAAFEAWELLSRAEVARVAWSGPDGVSILPVNCIVAEGALWFRTAPTSAIIRAGADLEVTVEADDLDPVRRTGWSVVMRAVVELVDPDDAPAVVSELRIWPGGSRTVCVRLEPLAVTGRQIVVARGS